MQTNPTFRPKKRLSGSHCHIVKLPLGTLHGFDGLMYPMAQSEFVDCAPKQYELIRGDDLMIIVRAAPWNYQGWVIWERFSRMKCGQASGQIIKDYVALAEWEWIRVSRPEETTSNYFRFHCAHMVAWVQFKYRQKSPCTQVEGLDWVVEAQPWARKNIDSCMKDIMPSGASCLYAFWTKPMNISFP